MSRSIMKLVQNVPVTFGVERTLRQLCCFCAPKQHVKMQISSRLRLTDQIMANCTPHGTKAWSFRSLDMLFEPKKISRITSTFSLKLSIEAIGFAVHMSYTHTFQVRRAKADGCTVCAHIERSWTFKFRKKGVMIKCCCGSRAEACGAAATT